MAEIPTPFEWNPAWTKEEHKEVFEMIKKLDDKRDDSDARKVCMKKLSAKSHFFFLQVNNEGKKLCPNLRIRVG